MKNRLAATLATALILSLGFTNPAFATWRPAMDSGGGQKTWGIKSGKNSMVNMGLTKKQAAKLAKKLNKIEKKDKKAAGE